MNKRYFTLKEWCYYLIRLIFGALTYIPTRIANWATDKLNKSIWGSLNEQEGK